jgi:phosphoribosyl 1,2-cyclic phosphodiesterase
LNHPQGAVGYRINFNGKSICYISDTEHAVGKIDENIKNLIQGSDVVIYDSTYTDEEYPNHIGWGHSTWSEGVKLCDAASVGKLIIFHHDPGHDDSDMDQIALEAENQRPGTIVAKEGMTITL